MGAGLRYFGGAVGFGFAAVWIMASLPAALVCLLSAVVGCGVGFAAERIRAKLAGRASRPATSTPRTVALPIRPPGAEDLPLWADALNSDLGHVYEPAATTSALSAEAEYGWPLIEDTVVLSEPLH